MTLFPRYSFWSNPGGAWVVRGGVGLIVPLNKNDQEPAGRPARRGRCSASRPPRRITTPPWRSAATSRPHDVPFGDLVLYAEQPHRPPRGGSEDTYVGVGPGTRFQITRDW